MQYLDRWAERSVVERIIEESEPVTSEPGEDELAKIDGPACWSVYGLPPKDLRAKEI